MTRLARWTYLGSAVACAGFWWWAFVSLTKFWLKIAGAS